MAELLLSKGYVVHGVKRRSSSFNTGRVDHLYDDPHVTDPRFILHYGDMTDSTNLIRIVHDAASRTRSTTSPRSRTCRSVSRRLSTRPTRMASGRCAFSRPSDLLGLEKKSRFYQASTSELYGKVQAVPQNETTPFYPALALRRGQALRVLDRGELPRGLRPARVERHPLQSRESAAGRDLSSRAR